MFIFPPPIHYSFANKKAARNDNLLLLLCVLLPCCSVWIACLRGVHLIYISLALLCNYVRSAAQLLGRSSASAVSTTCCFEMTPISTTAEDKRTICLFYSICGGAFIYFFFPFRRKVYSLLASGNWFNVFPFHSPCSRADEAVAGHTHSEMLSQLSGLYRRLSRIRGAVE